MLHFAYGSNMDYGQMRARCPSASFRCVAALKDHRIAFVRRSQRRRCGVAGAVEVLGEVVWGAVYAITEYDLRRLDMSEGYHPDGSRPNAYVREERQVLTGDGERSSLTVHVYFAVPQDDPPLPSLEYKDLIVRGAKFWQLPEAYVRMLEKIPCEP